MSKLESSFFQNTYVLSEALLVQVGGALDLAVGVGALGVLVNFERALATLRHVRTHESGCVHLELGTLRFDFELVVAVKSSLVFLEEARFLVHVGTSLGYSSRCFDLNARLGLFAAKEGRLVGCED